MERSIDPHRDGPDHVLENLSWVRALARRLVEDVADADDLVQEAWLEARGRSPRREDARGVRPWLGGLLRNTARSRRRDEARRAHHRSRAARGERAPRADEPDALVERSERLAEVARAALELPEPFRRTMLLRWFEGEPPSEIARIEGVTEATVRTRIHRGRALLRGALDRRGDGTSTGWALALVPYAAVPREETAALAGGVAGAVAAAAALIATVGSAWWAVSCIGATRAPVTTAGEAAPPSRRALHDGPESEDVGGPALAGADGATTGRAPATVGAVDDEPADEPSNVRDDRIAGVVVLADGTPVAGARVALRFEAADGSTVRVDAGSDADADGRFEVTGLPPEAADQLLEVDVRSDFEVPVTAGRLVAAGASDHRVEVDALLVRTRACDARGETVRTAWFQTDHLRSGGTPSMDMVRRTGGGSLGRGAWLVPTEGTFLFTAGSSAGDLHGALLVARPPGRAIDLALLGDPPSLGSIRARLQHPSLVDGAELNAHARGEGGARGPQGGHGAVAEDGVAEVRLEMLAPGEYEVLARLTGSPFLDVERRGPTVEVVAGVEQLVELEAFEGGVVRITAASNSDPEGRIWADVELRRDGEAGWNGVLLETRDEGAILVRSAALLDGPTADSRAVRPGDYDLRVSAEGHSPVTERVRVLVGEFADVEVTLEPLPR